MSEIHVDFGDRSYVVIVESGALGSLGSRISTAMKPSGVIVVTNPVVGEWYGDLAEASIAGAGLKVSRITIPAGERFKTMRTLDRVLRQMVELGADRRGVVVALGGGVVGDVAGFAAAVYMRGVRVVQVPTTLLAMVDASVGGKTGVDLPSGKNLVGAFHQPSLVLADIDTLRTLPARELRAGFAEVVKHGIIFDQGLFDFSFTNAEALLRRDTVAIEHVVCRSVEIKREVVQKDEREAGLRAILNYGHTVGHAIESLTGYAQYRHGEAIAIGMVVEARLSEVIGVAEAGLARRTAEALRRFRLPTAVPAELSADAILAAMMADKKTVGGELRFALPDRIGHCRVVEKVDANSVSAAIHQCRK
jgi:3-dehydroquinate synthase